MKKIFFSENADVFPGIITRNNAVLEYQNYVHRTFYPYTIHPCSSFRVIWAKTYLILIPLRLASTSLLWSVFQHNSVYYLAPMTLFHFLNFLDLVMRFFTGYVEPKTEIAVLDLKKIARKYLTTYFVVDFIPCIPAEIIYWMMFRHMTRTQFRQCISCQVLVYTTVFSVLFRLFAFYYYYHTLAKIMLWDHFLMGMICVFFAVYATLSLANGFYVMSELPGHFHNYSVFEGVRLGMTEYPAPNLSLGNRLLVYLDAFLMLTLDLLYHNSTPSVSGFERGVILTVSFFSSIIFVAYFIKFFIFKMTPREKFLDFESRVFSFVRKRHLPVNLRAKTLLYFQILQENKYYKEDEIFNYIPDTFKADIFFHLCLPILKNFFAFEDLPTYVLRCLAERMRYQLYLPNELIMQKDDPALSMYFVQRGTVALYSAKHVELYHFEGGSSFNGKNLMLGEPVTNTYAISIEVSEVYRLTQEDFFDIMREYPKLLIGVQEKLRLDKTGSSCIL